MRWLPTINAVALLLLLALAGVEVVEGLALRWSQDQGSSHAPAATIEGEVGALEGAEGEPASEQGVDPDPLRPTSREAFPEPVVGYGL